MSRGGHFVVSLDFELFWGVSDSQDVAAYGNSIRGVRSAIPAILDAFEAHGISATWATVGMVMCRDHAHWRSVRPAVPPRYVAPKLSNYRLDDLVRRSPDLFFAPDLVQRVARTPLQHVGSHTYSHFYCGAPGTDAEQFEADLVCAEQVGQELGLRFRSFVFPRNQVVAGCLPVLSKRGYEVFRGNLRHWLYRDGHNVAGGQVGRAVRLLDAYVPMRAASGSTVGQVDGLTDVPATAFLRPWQPRFSRLDPLRCRRIKREMSASAREGTIYHLWWHPHNFGIHLRENMAALKDILGHYARLRDEQGMQSVPMEHFA